MFSVSAGPVSDPSSLPTQLRPVPRLSEGEAVMTRDLTLEEYEGPTGEPAFMLLNGKHFDDPVTEKPVLGTTEIWRILNLTEDVHPIHLHFVQFQILDHRPIDVAQYQSTGRLVFTGPAMPPDPQDAGWKDTFNANPGEASRIIARYADYTGMYVWHCHILEHEDNEMMRPYEIVMPAPMASAAASGGETAALPPVVTADLPHSVSLSCFPNPGLGSQSVRFALPSAARVDLEIFSVSGRRVRTLASGEFRAGEHALSWDGRDDGGHPAPGGAYLYRLRAGNVSLTRQGRLIR